MDGKVMVTGGAGFIGSHLVDRLVSSGKDVVVFDNLSSGKMSNLERNENNDRFTFVKGDMLKFDEINSAMNGITKVYHLAANPIVSLGENSPEVHYNNILTTFNLLEAMRRNKTKRIVFTSTSAVYGDARKMPTPENYFCRPISTYGASKLSGESLLMSYYHTFGIDAVIYRLANVIGERNNHGVIFDFVKKMKGNSESMEILGDGLQEKSYIYISDIIDAMVLCDEKSSGGVDIFNIGSEDSISVRGIADLVAESLGLHNVKYNFTGGINGRGWKGDVKIMLLSTEKLKGLGWKPKYNSRVSVKKTIEDIKKIL